FVQTSLGDRVVLPMDQADLENQPFSRNLRERRSHSDCGCVDRISAAALGPRRQQDRCEPTRLRQGDPCKFDASTINRRASRSTTTSKPTSAANHIPV